MIHQGHAVVESQGVLIAECGPGEFLGEAGSGSSGVMETHLGGSKKQQIYGKFDGFNDPCFSGISEYLT